MRKLYMLTNVLPDDFGGRTRGFLRRASTAADLGHDIEVLFCGFQYQIEDHIEQLKESKFINENLTVTHWFNDLRKECNNFGEYKEPINLDDYKVTKRSNREGFFWLHKNGFLDRKVLFNNSNNKILRIDEQIKHSHSISSRSYFDTSGNLYRQIVYYPNIEKEKQSRKREYFYNPDGSPFIDVLYKWNDDKTDTEVAEIRYFNGKYPDITVTEWVQLRAYWINQKVQNNSSIILSARRLDKAVIDAKLDEKDVRLAFWLHNNHNDETYEDFLNYDKDCDVISLTEQQKQELIATTSLKPEKIKVFKQAYNKAIINEDYDKNKIVIVSRFENAQKNLLDAIDSFYIFWQKNQEFTLDIWGFGEDEEEIRAHINEHNLNDIVFLKGITENAEEKFANAAAFLITSHYEGLGKTIIESIACGCPVAAYNFKYGPQDFIKIGKSGYIDEQMTPESFAVTIENTVKINNRYSRKKISKYVSKNVNALKEESEYFNYLVDDNYNSTFLKKIIHNI